MPRLERDSLGPRDVPDEAGHDIHALRALQNFPLVGRPMQQGLSRAYGRGPRRGCQGATLMQATPRALRPHIGLFGRRWVGKSSLLQLAPADLSPYRLVVHCGNCTGNRREMLSRIHRCREAGVPITNDGLAIACSLGICERALAPFPSALEAYHAARS
jgi:hypothetical protein